MSIHSKLRRSLVLAALVVGGWGSAAYAAQPQYDLFYDYYVGGGRRGGVPAEMYPCPLPVPEYVGHTYVTYQPLMPHEFLYPHGRTYVRAGQNITHVSWKHRPIKGIVYDWRFK